MASTVSPSARGSGCAAEPPLRAADLAEDQPSPRCLKQRFQAPREAQQEEGVGRGRRAALDGGGAGCWMVRYCRVVTSSWSVSVPSGQRTHTLARFAFFRPKCATAGSAPSKLLPARISRICVALART